MTAPERIYRAICDESIFIDRREHAEHVAQTVARALKSQNRRNSRQETATVPDERNSNDRTS